MRDPASPCTGVCRIDAVSGWCTGCRRTLEEIADWPMLTGSEKHDVLTRLPGRGPPADPGVDHPVSEHPDRV